ncbi:ABC transporter permease subunit [Mycobacterium sp. 21AC1]|uniref:ABC transporter permease n=1 Tax=[Mycobacterium] appelbergii TaxID=2939269 RepID=UPI002938EDCE|nr:ABC transporter permease subunit [Mycobacterium sp. 21AC1]MDV3128404.1 ABC transporter permease subunit [Mycobacterium sp. 21AC1]
MLMIRPSGDQRATRLRRLVLGVCGIGLWLLGWQYFVTVGPLRDTAGLATASEAIRRTAELSTDGSFWQAVGETLVMAASGTMISLLIGAVLGLAMGLNPSISAALDPLVQVLKPIPPVVILPLALLALGPTRDLGVLLATIAALWPILIQVQTGARDVDPVALDTARALRLSVARTQLSVVLPSVIPYLLSGLRIGSATALMMSVGAGLLAGAPGLGRLILIAQQSGQGATVFSGTLCAGALGVLLTMVLAVTQRIITRDNWGRGTPS